MDNGVIVTFLRTRVNRIPVARGDILQRWVRRRRAACGKAERATHDRYEAPDREDNDETDNAPEDKLSSRRAFGVIIRAENKVSVHAEEEKDERDGEQYGRNKAVDDKNDTILIAEQIKCVDAHGSVLV
jgi:hypothetical protein